MDPTNANLQIFFTGLSLMFQGAYERTEIWTPKLAMEVPSSTELETYGWADRLPVMREWIGARQVNAQPTRSRSLVNKDWEETASIPRNKFLDDKLGLYSTLVTELGEQAKKLDDIQLSLLIQSNPIGFDNVAFFAATHLTNLDDPASAAQTNDLTTLALTPSNYSAARAKMRSFKGRDGQPLGSRGSLLVVPPSLEEAANNILNSDFIAPALFGGQTQVGSNDNKNTLKGTADLLVIDELENQPKIWYLLDNRKAVKPFLVQRRQLANFVYLNNATDPNVFWRKEYIYGADARAAYDVTVWWRAIRCGAGL